MNRTGRGGWLRLAFAGIGAASLLPLLVLAASALAPGWRYPEVLPAELDLRALRFVAAQGEPMLRALASSTAYSLATAALALALCVLPARLLARGRFRGKALAEGLLLAPALVPPMTFSMGVQAAFIRLGIIDTTLGVVLVLATFSYPYMLRALTAGYEAMGEGHSLCAANLGAGPWTVLLKVELPLLAPAVAAGASVVFLVAFSEYFLVFLIGGGRVASFMGYLYPFLTSSDRSAASALTFVFLAVPMALFVLLELAAHWRIRRRAGYRTGHGAGHGA
ncbi:MAG: ABC transporter permease [Desulfovibrionaceae bacterium]